jgi:hypothetical protein
MRSHYTGSKNEQNQPHGKGRYVWEDGSSFDGIWSSGLRVQGTYIMHNGNVYHGTFNANEDKNGKGSFFWRDGDIYEGEFLNDKIEGMGTYWYANGDKYHGNWKSAARHGPGILYIHSTGSFFHCIWGNNQPREGTWVNRHGHIYEGTFLNKQMHGTGTYTWPNGRSKTGEFHRGALKQQTAKLKPDHIPRWIIPKSFFNKSTEFCTSRTQFTTFTYPKYSSFT